MFRLKSSTRTEMCAQHLAQELELADVLLAGYRIASVIIALTDGELRETQFDLAAREVSS